MPNIENFKKFILKKLSGEVAFDEKCHSFRILWRTVSDPIRKAIYDEGHKYSFSDSHIDALFTKLQEEVELAYKPAEKSITHIEVSKLNPGEQLKLVGQDKDYGMAQLDLIYLGRSKETKLHRFMVLHASRLVLSAEDMVEVARNEMLSVGYPVQFNVYRQGKRIPNDELVYRTFRLASLTRIMPSIVHEIIDNKREFSYLENSVIDLPHDSGNSLSFGTNAMSLLLHEFSDSFQIYADFDDGGLGSFSSNPELDLLPSQTRNLLFGITKESETVACLRIETEKPGRLLLDKENLDLKLCAPATIKNSIKTDYSGLSTCPTTVNIIHASHCDLEQMALDIKESISSVSNVGKDKIRQWIHQFRNQGVSIIALEKLLNFYHESHDTLPLVESDYVIPGSELEDRDDMLKKCRDEIESLKQDNKVLEKSIAKWKRYFIVFLILFLVLLLYSIIMVLF